MQTDEEIGKVAAAVPVIICILGNAWTPAWVLSGSGRGAGAEGPGGCLASLGLGEGSRGWSPDTWGLSLNPCLATARALELFLESLLRKACQVTQSRNAKTMTTSHL